MDIRSNQATRHGASYLGGAKLGICWMMALGCVFASADTYRIKPGDSIEKVARKFHVRLQALLDANDIHANTVLRDGRRIIIPTRSSAPEKSTHETRASKRSHHESTTTSGESYTVRNGDNDWTIAHRNHITVGALRESNPNVNFASLQVGTHLSLPSGSEHEVSHQSSHLASHVEETQPARGVYHVRGNDNDWTIAAKLGITLKSLHRANPGVNWNAIGPGKVLHVPASVGEHSSSKSSHRITTRLAAINADGATLRRGPSTNSEKVTTVDAGTVARVLDHEGKWYKLRFPKGTEAWVRADLLNSVKHHHRQAEPEYASNHHSRRRRHHGHSPEPAVAMNEIKSSKLLTTAYSYRGTPYRTGGTSRSSGFDCSGFTSTVLRKNGVYVPRTAAEQSQVGQHVGKDNLKKGDLVFFRTNRGVRINHVGMYIGDGKFIHASSGGGRVQVSSLSEGYYSRRFAGGRRVVKPSAHHKKKPAS